VTSNDEQDNDICQVDFDTYTDPTIQDDYDDYSDGGEDIARRQTDLVFFGLEENLPNTTDKQLVEMVLENSLGLDPSQYIEEVERFGINKVRPIRVTIPTMDKCEEILRRAKRVKRPEHLSTVGIEPFRSRDDWEIYQELKVMRQKFVREGYENVKIESPKLVHIVNGKPGKVLYNAVGDCDSVMTSVSRCQ